MPATAIRMSSPRRTTVLNQVVLTARPPGADGNDVTYSVTITPQDSTDGGHQSPRLRRRHQPPGRPECRQDRARQPRNAASDTISPTIRAAPADADPLPRSLAGVEVYFNGIPAPLLYVSPSQINAQIPWDVVVTTRRHSLGTDHCRGRGQSSLCRLASASFRSNPGIFAESAPTPAPRSPCTGAIRRPAWSRSMASINAGDVGKINIASANYTYTVQASDTLDTVRDAFIAQINASDPIVTASACRLFPSHPADGESARPGCGRYCILRLGHYRQLSRDVGLTSFLCCASVEGALR